MKSYQQLFAELKRRKVFKVAAVYGATAFVLLQVADLLGQGLRLPDSFMPFITAVILIGFPLALILTWAFEVTPEGVQRTGAAAPGEIERIVAEPASKRWPAGLLAIAGIVALLAGVWWAGRQSAPGVAASDERAETVQLAYGDPTDDDRPSIAVLPFVNMSGDVDQEYFSDGMTEEILNTLAKVDELRVAGRTSAFAYKGEGKDLREIGTELGVAYLVEGSVRKAGNQIRITAQLIDASDGSHLWSDQYDRRLEDIFAIQTEIAEAIAEALRVPLGLESDERLVSPTGDLGAYDLYLAGRSEMRKRGSGLREAVRLFEAAIARDSTWAPAWAALAEAREIGIWYPRAFDVPYGDSTFFRRSLEQAEFAARQALEHDARNASALVAMGSVLRDRHETERAEAYYRRALAIDPDNPEAYQQYGELLYESGRIAEAVRALDRAAALDPAAVRLSVLGFALELDDRFEEASRVAELGLARDPDVEIPQMWAGAMTVNARLGRADAALAVIRRFLEVAGSPPGAEAEPEFTDEEFRTAIEAITDGRPDDIPEAVWPVLTPELWMTAGDRERALAGLEAWIRPGIPWEPSFWLPAWDPVRDDPAFRRLLEGTGVLDGELRRTPPSERTLPMVLRSAEERPVP